LGEITWIIFVGLVSSCWRSNWLWDTSWLLKDTSNKIRKGTKGNSSVLLDTAIVTRCDCYVRLFCLLHVQERWDWRNREILLSLIYFCLYVAQMSSTLQYFRHMTDGIRARCRRPSVDKTLAIAWICLAWISPLPSSLT
jgi:hypothetical protein